MTRRTYDRVCFALGAFPLLILAEGIFFGLTGMTMFDPHVGAVFIRVIIAVLMACALGAFAENGRPRA